MTARPARKNHQKKPPLPVILSGQGRFARVVKETVGMTPGEYREKKHG